MSEQNALNSTPRIRCTYCNRRIPASSIICPHCQHNPRAFYWKRRHLVFLLIILALFAIVGGFYFRQDLKQFVPSSISLNQTATPTLTLPPLTVVIVVTRPPATSTLPPPTGTRTNAATPRPTDVPTVSFTATRPGTASAITTRLPTETPSPIPTIKAIPAPQLLSPTDEEALHGGNKPILLDFQPAQPIGLQDWYLVEVTYIAREGYTAKWCEFSKVSPTEFPKSYYEDSSPNVRSFSWRVTVVHSNQIAPSTCDAPYDILSASSDPWTFYWY